MSGDARLRELERRWQRSGDVEDEARFLGERLRRGDLAVERVELAAFVNHGPARTVLGDAAPTGLYAPFRRWAATFDLAGRIALARVAADLVDQELAELDREPDGRLPEALAAARAWCRCPCPTHESLASEWVPAIEALANDLLGEGQFLEAIPCESLREACQIPRATSEELGKILSSLALAPEAGALTPWALGEGHAHCPAQDDPIAAEGRYLAHRIKVGDLSRERVELAAYAGYLPAAQAVELEPPSEDPAAWVAGLSRWGPDALRGFAAALVRGKLVIPLGETALTPVAVRFILNANRILIAAERDMLEWAGTSAAPEVVDGHLAALRRLETDPAIAAAPGARDVVGLGVQAWMCSAGGVAEVQALLERAMKRLGQGVFHSARGALPHMVLRLEDDDER